MPCRAFPYHVEHIHVYESMSTYPVQTSIMNRLIQLNLEKTTYNENILIRNQIRRQRDINKITLFGSKNTLVQRRTLPLCTYNGYIRLTDIDQARLLKQWQHAGTRMCAWYTIVSPKPQLLLCCKLLSNTLPHGDTYIYVTLSHACQRLYLGKWTKESVFN